MLNIYKLGTKECDEFLGKLSKRAQSPEKWVIDTVNEILDNVRLNGDKAVLEYTEKFDKVSLTPQTLEMSKADLEKAAQGVDRDLYATMEKAAANIRKYHEKQLRKTFFMDEDKDKTIGMRITPMRRAGIYVPGGSAAYPSSVLMNCIPARLRV